MVENIKDKARFFFEHYGVTDRDLEQYLGAALSVVTFLGPSQLSQSFAKS